MSTRCRPFCARIRENIARVLPRGCDAVLRKSAWDPPPIFGFLRGLGTTSAEMWRVFNMGVGYVFIVRPRFVTGVVSALQDAGERPFEIGRVHRGTQRVRFQRGRRRRR